MNLPEIKGFIDISLVDWDGKVSAVIFLPHCNFRCPFCYNPTLVLNPERMQTVPHEKVMGYLAKKRDWIEGVVITGGEPTLHRRLLGLCKRVKGLGLGVKLDTNGTNPTAVQELIDQELVDYVAMDVKAPLTNEKYSMVTGVDAVDLLIGVRETMRVLLKGSVNYEFRTTLIPAIHESGDILQICREIRSCRKYVLQTFKGNVETVDPKFKDAVSFSPDDSKRFLELAREIVPNTFLR